MHNGCDLFNKLMGIKVTSYIVIFGAIIMLFPSCSKRKYKCVCTAHVVYYTPTRVPMRFEENYHTEQQINKKLSKEKARSSCELVEQSFTASVPNSPYVSVSEKESRCVIE